MFHIETTNDLSNLLADSETWNNLAGGVPFRETSWLDPWWRQFGQGKRARVVVAKDDSGMIRGMLPLYGGDDPAGGRWLSLIGDTLAFSDYVSVLAREQDRVQVARAIGAHLASTARDQTNGWDLLDIDGVVEGDEAMAAFAHGLQSGGVGIHAHSRMSTWFRPREESWDQHLKSHSKTQRRRMRRMSDKVISGAIARTTAESHAQVETYLDALIEMHQRRWNLDGEPGSYSDPRFCDFIMDAAKRFQTCGRLDLVALTHRGQIVAAELNFIGENRVLYSYSCGYDIDAAELEPSRILGVTTLQRLYTEDLVGVDFMRGDEPYKSRMKAIPRRVFRLRAAAPTWLPRLRHAAWSTGFEFKQWMRRRTGRQPVDVADFVTSAPFIHGPHPQ